MYCVRYCMKAKGKIFLKNFDTMKSASDYVAYLLSNMQRYEFIKVQFVYYESCLCTYMDKPYIDFIPHYQTICELRKEVR